MGRITFWITYFILILFLTDLGTSPVHAASTTTFSPQPQRTLRPVRRAMPRSTSVETPVDLSTTAPTLSTPSTATDSSTSTNSANSSYASKPNVALKNGNSLAWKAYFDLLLLNRPGVVDLTFANVHSYLFLDMFPSQQYQFSFDVSSARGSPSYFQLDWTANPRLKVSVGKIWIPFDDLDPHNLFGGRTNASDEMFRQVNAPAFLPSLWTDLGVGAKYTLIDTQQMVLVSNLYIVNGFASGGSDPKGIATSYPSFGDTTLLTRDNNADKAIGGRVHATLGHRFGIGVSAYTDRWNDSKESQSKRLTILGADGQLRLNIAEVRAGAVAMNVNLGNESFKRGGFYGELGIPFADNKWKLLIREGSVQLDDRVENIYDQTLVGGKLLYRPNFIQWSAEYSKDIQSRAGKKGVSLWAMRCVFEL